MLRYNFYNTVSDLGTTFEHFGDVFRSHSAMYHGPQCMWCSLRKQNNNVPNKNLKYSHPSTNDLNASGSITKKAVYVGINYLTSTQNVLKGCINDANNVQRAWEREFHVKEFKLLTDDTADESLYPTKRNIRQAIRWLTIDVKKGDIIFFHYSGHGTQIQDENNDEKDGNDEVLVPVDFKTEGYMVDDDIFRLLVAAVPKGVTLIATIDCCHSGTIFDLPNTYVAKGSALLLRSQPKFVKGNVICISASLDTQTAEDVVTKTDAYGKLTNTMLKCLTKRHMRCTLADLLKDMTSDMLNTSQTPCISVSDHVDINNCYFALTN
jgi:hypothetical protein